MGFSSFLGLPCVRLLLRSSPAGYPASGTQLQIAQREKPARQRVSLALLFFGHMLSAHSLGSVLARADLYAAEAAPATAAADRNRLSSAPLHRDQHREIFGAFETGRSTVDDDRKSPHRAR